MNKEILEETILRRLPGKQINEVTAGGSNGSIIILQIGIADFCLFVKCVWRLQKLDKVLTGWNESNLPIVGNLTKQINELTTDVITKVETSDFFDLQIHFVSGKALNIFCDVTPKYEPDYYDENWVICDIKANICYTIKKDFSITTSVYR